MTDSTSLHIETKPQAPIEAIFAFPIDVPVVLQHLRQDMRDDWFNDALSYVDIFNLPNHLRATLKEILNEHNGHYESGGRVSYDIPKSNLGLRYALETDFYDRFIYQAIASYLIPFYDPLLSNRVLGHRFDPEPKNKKYIFKHRIELWNTFEGMTKAAFDSSSVVLATDLINYYENITTASIINALLANLPSVQADGIQKNRIRNAIATLEGLLNKWCYTNLQGLPQNRDASSFFANILLNTVDRKMAGMGYDYFRYVDDIRIICPDEASARKALNDLIRELRRIGLNINSGKTKILTKSSPAATLTEFFPQTDDRTIAIDHMWKSRSRRVIARSMPLIHQLVADLISKGNSQSRQFRFCINRLTAMIEAEVIDCTSAVTPELEGVLLELLYTQPASTDHFCKIAALMGPEHPIFSKIETYILDPSKSIYSWQNYNLWMLLAKADYGTPALLKIALTKINSDIEGAEIPAIFIYLGKRKQHDELKKIVPLFSRAWPYQHKRLFLIAAQALDKESLAPLVEQLDSRVAGTIKRITSRKSIRDPFFQKADPNNILDIFNDMSPYD